MNNERTFFITQFNDKEHQITELYLYLTSILQIAENQDICIKIESGEIPLPENIEVIPSDDPYLQTR